MSKQNPDYPGQYPEKSDFADSPPAYQDPGMAGYQTSYPGPQQYVAYPPGQGPYPPAQPYPSPQGQYPMGQGPAVTMQPAIYVQRAPLAHPMPDYLGYSIFTMLCCCLPLGIAALIYSISVSRLFFFLLNVLLNDAQVPYHSVYLQAVELVLVIYYKK
ncbi:UNVERIFIED_CONTAM: hypothetical protein FKN15_039525 [Acipenser sinensis]